MATTSNYGWTTPDDTSLVKDGASAIRALGTAIDTSMNTALGTKKAGMVLLNTTSFSGVASQSINDVFSATYDHYKVLLYWTGASGSGTLTFRYRVSGSDNSTSNYGSQIFSATDTSLAGSRGSGATSHSLGTISTNFNFRQMEIFRPFLTENTGAIHTQYFRADQNQNSQIQLQGFSFQANTSFTGFSLLSDGANISGTVSVYGYNK